MPAPAPLARGGATLSDHTQPTQELWRHRIPTMPCTSLYRLTLVFDEVAPRLWIPATDFINARHERGCRQTATDPDRRAGVVSSPAVRRCDRAAAGTWRDRAHHRRDRAARRRAGGGPWLTTPPPVRRCPSTPPRRRAGADGLDESGFGRNGHTHARALPLGPSPPPRPRRPASLAADGRTLLRRYKKSSVRCRLPMN